MDPARQRSALEFHLLQHSRRAASQMPIVIPTTSLLAVVKTCAPQRNTAAVRAAPEIVIFLRVFSRGQRPRPSDGSCTLHRRGDGGFSRSINHCVRIRRVGARHDTTCSYR